MFHCTSVSTCCSWSSSFVCVSYHWDEDHTWPTRHTVETCPSFAIWDHWQQQLFDEQEEARATTDSSLSSHLSLWFCVLLFPDEWTSPLEWKLRRTILLTLADLNVRDESLSRCSMCDCRELYLDRVLPWRMSWSMSPSFECREKGRISMIAVRVFSPDSSSSSLDPRRERTLSNPLNLDLRFDIVSELNFGRCHDPIPNCIRTRFLRWIEKRMKNKPPREVDRHLRSSPREWSADSSSPRTVAERSLSPGRWSPPSRVLWEDAWGLFSHIDWQRRLI